MTICVRACIYAASLLEHLPHCPWKEPKNKSSSSIHHIMIFLPLTLLCLSACGFDSLNITVSFSPMIEGDSEGGRERDGVSFSFICSRGMYIHIYRCISLMVNLPSPSLSLSLTDHKQTLSFSFSSIVFECPEPQPPFAFFLARRGY